MIKSIEKALLSKGYTNIKYKESVFDTEDFQTVIAYNFIATNEDKKKVLVSVELGEDAVIIWESLDGEHNGGEWWLINEVAI